MNLAKISGGVLIVAGKLTNQDWIQIIAIVIMVLGMIQDYLEGKKDAS